MLQGEEPRVAGPAGDSWSDAAPVPALQLAPPGSAAAGRRRRGAGTVPATPSWRDRPAPKAAASLLRPRHDLLSPGGARRAAPPDARPTGGTASAAHTRTRPPSGRGTAPRARRSGRSAADPAPCGCGRRHRLAGADPFHDRPGPLACRHCWKGGTSPAPEAAMRNDAQVLADRSHQVVRTPHGRQQTGTAP